MRFSLFFYGTLYVGSAENFFNVYTLMKRCLCIFFRFFRFFQPYGDLPCETCKWAFCFSLPHNIAKIEFSKYHPVFFILFFYSFNIILIKWRSNSVICFIHLTKLIYSLRLKYAYQRIENLTRDHITLKNVTQIFQMILQSPFTSKI